ncbi:EARP and GARP complex-interacting protein 1 [Drosophila nasuta]|uniref:EARP and GARP complex-interacting protein 1 n=1 Tax=Drosophila nasuta TaxID=42062 RepID=UPI00295E5BA2|nr:EARP and GARP complex-interacting protein 1 [Drosophila nasuta]XP_060653944.1 EARP and GARP complex-interacting protein 1 [Drosophila nasuta]XP_060653945.1 EARP and GARP complex-interacting protein 1 [Drosophila nasuta]XP_060653946.1 EARP and GARP complex-interacting protein 1 [Drosophila nasuta]
MEENSLIYGLELQARALTPQYGESNDVCFFIATNSLKPTNQLHLLQYDEEQGTIQSKIFEHALGEVWKLNSCPHDARLLASVYNVQKGAQVLSQAALLTLPEDDPNASNNEPLKSEYIPWAKVEVLDTASLGDRVKTIEFHPSQEQTIACVAGNKLAIMQRAESATRVVAEASSNSSGAKSVSSFTSGKWSHHHQGHQFVVLHDSSVRAYDVRDSQHCAWSIDDAHGQLVRDLDCNPNKQCHLVTGGDDGCLKVWDCRMVKAPVFERSDHSHWLWSVRFNTFHDQLILSSSSDCKVLLTCAGSVSSEAVPSDVSEASAQERHKVLSDGLLQTFDQHEDSVYCAEWSNVDPWIFASLSYDGRVIISKVPKQYKYQIIF